MATKASENNVSDDCMQHCREFYFWDRWRSTLRYYMRTLSVYVCFSIPFTKSRWMSCLRCYSQVLFRKVVGSNPIPLINIFHVRLYISISITLVIQIMSWRVQIPALNEMFMVLSLRLSIFHKRFWSFSTL